MKALPKLTDDRRDTARKLALLTTIITGLMSLVAMFDGDSVQLVVELFTCLVAAAFYFGLRSDRGALGPILVMGVIGVIGANVVYSATETGGVSSVSLGWLPTLTIAAYAIAGRTAGIVTAAASIVSTAVLFCGEQFGLFSLPGFTPASTAVIDYGLLTLGTLGIIYVFEQAKRVEFQREREAEARVERMNADLQQALEEVAELESRLIESERHGSLQRLAGHFAHDFNNLLTGIMAEVDLAAYTVADPDIKEGLENALNSARKAADLTRSMLTYSGHRTTRMTSTTASRLFDDVQKLAELSTRHGVEFVVEDDTDGVAFKGDVTQLEQALLNLVLNGVQASDEDRPRVHLAASMRANDDTIKGAGGSELVAGNAVRLEVRDFGRGIPDELRAAIFEPYFTTRESGQGLGLSSVVGIVRAHKGALTLETHADGGASFAIELPVAACTRPQ
jgi:signal transduction histidine kinase